MSIEIPLHHKEGAIEGFSMEKHRAWLEKTKIDLQRELRGISYKALIVLSSLAFAATETQNKDFSKIYPLKDWMGVGLSRKKAGDDIEAQEKNYRDAQ